MVFLKINNSSTAQSLTKGGSMPGASGRLGVAMNRSSSSQRIFPVQERFQTTTPDEPTQDKNRPSTGSSQPGGRPPCGFSAVPRWKRWMDLCAILLTFPIWMPLMAFIGIWIKMVSRGPVFFRQVRVGHGGRTFTMLKFRSMKNGVDTKAHEDHFRRLVETESPMVKLDCLGDSRLIPGGRFLRVTGLDELPQIINVLRGEMSLVGPRPCTPGELECYQERQAARFEIPPGLTGYWQVKGKNRTTFKQMVDMDIQYGERMSFLFDLAIIIATLPALALQAIESRWRPTPASRTTDARDTSAPRQESRHESMHNGRSATQLIS